MSSSISPDSQNFDTTDQAAMEEKGDDEEADDQVKNEQGHGDCDMNDGECHPVE